jgi:hypothetical protein
LLVFAHGVPYSPNVFYGVPADRVRKAAQTDDNRLKGRTVSAIKFPCHHLFGDLKPWSAIWRRVAASGFEPGNQLGLMPTQNMSELAWTLAFRYHRQLVTGKF